MWLVLRSLLATLILPGTVLVWAPVLWIAGRERFAAHWPPLLVDSAPWALIALGAAVYVWCAWSFAAEGSGTAAPWDPPKLVVRGGLYRWTRNPMYVGVTTALIGESWLTDSRAMWIYTALVTVGFHLRVLMYEEPAMRRLDAAGWEAYAARVKRWGLF